VKHLPYLDQIPDSGHPRDGWQWDSDGSMHDRFIWARDSPLNGVLSRLAMGEPESVALFNPQCSRIYPFSIEEK